MRRRNSLPERFLDINVNLGDKFGHLTVLADTHDVPLPNGEYQTNFLCECDCPNHTLILVMGSRLKNGQISDCGCSREYANQTIAGNVNPVFKLSPTRAADVRNEIINKCQNPLAVGYHNHCGAGITVCPQWMDPVNGVMQFYNDMGPSYVMGYEIDRIDTSLGYTPENCKWVPHDKKNKKDRRPDERIATCSNGDTYTIAQWQYILGYNESTLFNRWYKGWPDELIICGKPGMKAQIPVYHNAIYFIDENGNPVPDFETENPNRTKERTRYAKRDRY